jgi:hypothetical protein
VVAEAEAEAEVHHEQAPGSRRGRPSSGARPAPVLPGAGPAASCVRVGHFQRAERVSPVATRALRRSSSPGRGTAVRARGAGPGRTACPSTARRRHARSSPRSPPRPPARVREARLQTAQRKYPARRRRQLRRHDPGGQREHSSCRHPSRGRGRGRRVATSLRRCLPGDSEPHRSWPSS